MLSRELHANHSRTFKQYKYNEVLSRLSLPPPCLGPLYTLNCSVCVLPDWFTCVNIQLLCIILCIYNTKRIILYIFCNSWFVCFFFLPFNSIFQKPFQTSTHGSTLFLLAAVLHSEVEITLVTILILIDIF